MPPLLKQIPLLKFIPCSTTLSQTIQPRNLTGNINRIFTLHTTRQPQNNNHILASVFPLPPTDENLKKVNQVVYDP
jgi:hypothetical protein